MSWVVGVAIKELEIFVSQIFYNFFLFISFFQLLYFITIFLYFFYPRHLTTPTPTTHDLDLPTTHYPPHLATLIDAELTCLFIVCETMFTIGESQAILYENGTEQQTQERRL